MPSGENRAIIATAGSGKTAEVVQSALDIPTDEQILITTYTNRNQAEIAKSFECNAAMYRPIFRF